VLLNQNPALADCINAVDKLETQPVGSKKTVETAAQADFRMTYQTHESLFGRSEMLPRARA
jgi:hypothetical protein